MYRCDSHLHTKYSFDADQGKGGEVLSCCEAALRKGLQEISFTDHYEVDFTNTGIFEGYNADAAQRDIFEAKERYNGRLKINYGIEIGQPLNDVGHAKAIVESLPFDYVIGSHHSTVKGLDFCFFKFDEMSPALFDYYFSDYLDTYRQMIELPFIMTASHLTYPVRYAKKGGLDIDLKKFYPTFEAIFRRMIERGVSLEVNTSGLRQGLGFTLPDYDILALYRQCGGKLLTVGSDAHTADHIGFGFEEVYGKLKEIGFTAVTTYENKQVKQILI